MINLLWYLFSLLILFIQTAFRVISTTPYRFTSRLYSTNNSNNNNNTENNTQSGNNTNTNNSETTKNNTNTNNNNTNNTANNTENKQETPEQIIEKLTEELEAAKKDILFVVAERQNTIRIAKEDVRKAKVIAITTTHHNINLKRK